MWQIFAHNLWSKVLNTILNHNFSEILSHFLFLFSHLLFLLQTLTSILNSFIFLIHFNDRSNKVLITINSIKDLALYLLVPPRDIESGLNLPCLSQLRKVCTCTPKYSAASPIE